MLAEYHPDWDDETLFQTARLINAAVMAKIHTVEWTPAILPNHSLNDGMMSNWYGLMTNAFGGKRQAACSRRSRSPAASSGASSATRRARSPSTGSARSSRPSTGCTRCSPTSCTSVDLDGTPGGRHPAGRDAARRLAALIDEYGIEALARTVRRAAPGALVNNNYPASMQDLSMPGRSASWTWAPSTSTATASAACRTYNQLRRESGSSRSTLRRADRRPRRRGASCATSTAPTARAATTSTTWTCSIGTLTEAHRPDRLRLRRDAVPDLHPQRELAAARRPLLHRRLPRRGVHRGGARLGRRGELQDRCCCATSRSWRRPGSPTSRTRSSRGTRAGSARSGTRCAPARRVSAPTRGPVTPPRPDVRQLRRELWTR